MRYSDPRLVQHLSAAYVLGTLTGGARRRFDRLLQQRADLALAVAQWEGRLGRLAGVVPPATPPVRVWEAIAARTRPPVASAASSDARAPRGWALFPGLLVFGSGAALAMGLMLTLPGLFFTPEQVAMRAGERLPQSYVGLLTDAKGDGKLLVSSLRHGRTMTIKAIGPMPAPAPGRHLVLWAVPASGAAFALGVAPTSGASQSQLPDTSERLLSKVSKLVVTEEAAGAMPAAPGAPVYSGHCAKLW